MAAILYPGRTKAPTVWPVGYVPRDVLAAPSDPDPADLADAARWAGRIASAAQERESMARAVAAKTARRRLSDVRSKAGETVVAAVALLRTEPRPWGGDDLIDAIGAASPEAARKMLAAAWNRQTQPLRRSESPGGEVWWWHDDHHEAVCRACGCGPDQRPDWRAVRDLAARAKEET